MFHYPKGIVSNYCYNINLLSFHETKANWKVLLFDLCCWCCPLAHPLASSIEFKLNSKAGVIDYGAAAQAARPTTLNSINLFIFEFNKKGREWFVCMAEALNPLLLHFSKPIPFNKRELRAFRQRKKSWLKEEKWNHSIPFS